METPVLDISGLSVTYNADSASPLHAVRDLSFRIAPGEAYGLIGESGSGKSTVAYAIMRHLPAARATARHVALCGRDVLGLPMAELAQLRGRQVAMVYQDPMSALNPVLRVGEQVAEVLRRHRGMTYAAARQRTLALFAQVHLPDPATLVRRYPHQLSGGQQQRVVIAMAIACQPELLIMDEPTTGLDVTTEAVILELIRELRRSIGAAVLFISHNLAVVANVCDQVGVLYAGQLVEQGPARDVLLAPRHPYTSGLLAATPQADARQHVLRAIPGGLPDLREVPSDCIFRPRCGWASAVCATAPALRHIGSGRVIACYLPSLPRQPSIVASRARPDMQHAANAAPRLAIAGLTRWFRSGGLMGMLSGSPPVRAVDGVTLTVAAGGTLAIVGESGSGKSTLARCVAGLLAPGKGQIRLDGQQLAAAVERRSRAEQQAIQYIFQNPDSSLNPHHTAAEIVGRPLQLYARLRGVALQRRVAELLDAVKLSARHAGRFPRELSGGEKQRVCIARAFAAAPRLVICDEPTSALDISVQAAILNELAELQARFGTSYLFISHDLAVVRHIADVVAVMHRGEVVEQGPPDQVFTAPVHPYTQRLLQAIPRLEAA
ncbi:MAG TPA: ABC transporter ATP-binding protein [Acetobacteraceae bacterium]